MNSGITLPSPHETGKLRIKQLKRFWQATQLNRSGKAGAILQSEWQLNKVLLGALSLGLEQTITHIYQNAPSFDDFEDWIIDTTGIPDNDTLDRFNRIFDSKMAETETIDPILSADDLIFFETNGYVVIKNAVPEDDCKETINVICDFLGIKQDQPDTWYKPNPARQGIMVQLFQHPILTKNRSSDKIRRAFEQLWHTKNIWMNNDRVGFNPPETENWKFPGPDLHWDCSLELPIPFGLQGILYLSDTAANQGAFTLVPGFQHRLQSWLNSLPAGADPRRQDLHALGSMPITGETGDFIIWQQALQHGSSPNTSAQPRFVQYINYQPLGFTEHTNWL
ncbi:phytanoyl-CoA dioxygenase family protein [Mucilaginibacter rigui]|uniref:Phytanoyl-CoA dioxygenase family protein n=1 Tax=Mucilaginibacter rigui TaxID=534635 RepID=A0ABR7X490_9SPHI|nr:phytanoyl-CoA dioxygenase family protein [Mucilaginibacter rigui]MBD1385405.1 phytanoyl-CoA dioxygenase family protein [Mucilaginibacter rigui]